MQAPLPATGPAVLARAAREYRTDIALEEGGRRWTYLELESEVRRAAAAFMAAGLQHGDRVAIWAPNMGRWIIAALGAQSVGGIVVPLNTRLKGREAGYILNRSGARILVHVGEFLGTRFADLLAGESLPALERRIAIDSADWDEFLAAGAAVADAEVTARLGRLRGEDVADILFTSGTTGQPKGVMCSHTQNIRVFDAWASVVGLERGDRYLIVNPFFHTFGYKSGWLVCLLRGATILPMAVFDADEVMRRIVADRI